MLSTKITEGEIAKLKISSLPTRPTAPKSFGGSGYTASEMKAAFDKLPLFIISRFNTLIDDIRAEGEDSLTAEIPSGIKDEHSLADMLRDITSGAFASYMQVLGAPLTEVVSEIRATLEELKRGGGEPEDYFEERIFAIEQTLITIFDTIGDLNEDINMWGAEVRAIGNIHENDVQTIYGRINDAEDDIDDISSDLDELEAELSVAKDRIDALENGGGQSILDLVREEIRCPQDISIDCGGPEGLS